MISVFLSRVDATFSRTLYTIEFDPETYLPRAIDVTVLTGVKKPAAKYWIGKQKHVAFHFSLRLREYGSGAAIEVPRPALRLLQ